MRGVIGKIVFGSLEKIFLAVPYQKIEPQAKSKEDAIKINRKLLGKAAKYVTFEICSPARSRT